MKKIDKPLLVISIILFSFGLIMVLSASSMESYMRYEASPYNYFIKQLIFILSGIVLFFFTILIPTKKYKHLATPAIILVAISLIGLNIYGYAAKNAESWYNLGLISIQPSEIAKVFIIVYLAVYYDKNKDKLNNKFTLLLPLIICGIITIFVALQPDLGTASIIFLLTIIMFYSVPLEKGGRSLVNKLFIGIIIVFGSVILVTHGSIFKEYQLKRLNFLNPCDRYQEDTGYQLCNSFIAFKNGELLGQGIGKSTQKYLYLPESYTDFIFPIIVEEWGLLIGILIIILFFVIFYRLIKIARNAHNLRNSLLAYGIFAYIFLHVIINLVGVMGLAPLTGVPLPFLSYGGSFCWSLMIALGLAQRVSIENGLTNPNKKIDYLNRKK